MRTKHRSHVARTLSAAKRLGHEPTPEKMNTLSSHIVDDGIHFAPQGIRENAICFIGPCDPQTNQRLVGYYDENGNCNNFVKAPC
jgi:hypothetical protein